MGRPVGSAQARLTSISRTARCGPACRVVWQGSGRNDHPLCRFPPDASANASRWRWTCAACMSLLSACRESLHRVATTTAMLTQIILSQAVSCDPLRYEGIEKWYCTLNIVRWTMLQQPGHISNSISSVRRPAYGSMCGRGSRCHRYQKDIAGCWPVTMRTSAEMREAVSVGV